MYGLTRISKDFAHYTKGFKAGCRYIDHKCYICGSNFKDNQPLTMIVLDYLPEGNQSRWICSDCKKGLHLCPNCEKGQLDTQTGVCNNCNYDAIEGF